MKAAIALVLFCYVTAGVADVRSTFSTPFSAASSGPNSIQFPTNFPGVVSSAAYSISVNATPPFTFVSVSDLTITFSEDSVDSGQNGINLQNEVNSTIIASTSGFSDPCSFPVSNNKTVVIQYNATTDTPDGRITTSVGLVDVLQINNGVEIDVNCPTFASCTRFLYLDIVNPPADEYFFNLTVTRVNGDTPVLTVAGGPETCPNRWSSTKGVRVQQKLDDTPLIVNATLSKTTTRFWVQYSVFNPISDRARLLFSWTASTLPEAPVSSPSSTEPSDDFPKWAIALLVLGGLLIVGMIIFFAVKAARKNSKGYTDI